MQVAQTSEKLIVLVLTAILGTWFLGQELLERAPERGDGTVAAAGPGVDAPPAEQRSPADPERVASPSGTPTGRATPEGAEPGAAEGPTDGPTDGPTAGPPDTAGAAADPVGSAMAPRGRPVRVRGAVSRAGVGLAVRLAWRPLDALGDAELRAVQSDGEGRYAVTLTRPGRYRVHVSGAGLLDGLGPEALELFVDVPSDATATIPLPLPTGRLAGRLESSAGDPVEDAFVELVPLGGAFGLGGAAAGSTPAATRRRALSDDEGRFAFDCLPAGRYRVQTTVDPADGSRVEGDTDGERAFARSSAIDVDGVGEATVTLRLPAGAGTTTVRVFEGGTPAFGATVLARSVDADGGPPHVLGTTDRDGALRVPVLPAGALELFAVAPGGISSPVLPVDGADTRLDLVPGQELVVVVRDRAERDVPATVELVRESPTGPRVWARSRTEDLVHAPAVRALPGTSDRIDARVHAFPALPPGTYVVEVRTADGRGERATVTLREGGDPLERVVELGD